MMTVMLILVVAAFIAAIVAALGKAPLWVSIFLLCTIELLRELPLGR